MVLPGESSESDFGPYRDLSPEDKELVDSYISMHNGDPTDDNYYFCLGRIRSDLRDVFPVRLRQHYSLKCILEIENTFDVVPGKVRPEDQSQMRDIISEHREDVPTPLKGAYDISIQEQIDMTSGNFED